MTREELIEMLNILLDNAKIGCADKTIINYVSFDSFKFVLAQTIKALSQEPCDDAISREAVCDYIAEFVNNEYSTQAECDMVDLMIKGIQHLPSVTQKSGKWIDYRDDGFVECPFCGHATNCEDDIDELHYCFYCGAKMKSEDEE